MKTIVVIFSLLVATHVAAQDEGLAKDYKEAAKNNIVKIRQLELYQESRTKGTIIDDFDRMNVTARIMILDTGRKIKNASEPLLNVLQEAKEKDIPIKRCLKYATEMTEKNKTFIKDIKDSLLAGENRIWQDFNRVVADIPFIIEEHATFCKQTSCKSFDHCVKMYEELYSREEFTRNEINKRFESVMNYLDVIVQTNKRNIERNIDIYTYTMLSLIDEMKDCVVSCIKQNGCK